MPDALRTDLIRLASELPKGDPTRQKILAALQGKEAGSWSGIARAIDRGGYRIQLIRWGLGSFKLAELEKEQDLVLKDSARLVTGLSKESEVIYKPSEPPVHDATEIKKPVGIAIFGPWIEFADKRYGKKWGLAMANAIGYKSI